MLNFNMTIRELLGFLNIFSIIKSLFKGSTKADKIYRVVFLGVVSFIIAKVVRIGYRLYKYGCVREIERTADEDDDGEGVEGVNVLNEVD